MLGRREGEGEGGDEGGRVGLGWVQRMVLIEGGEGEMGVGWWVGWEG